MGVSLRRPSFLTGQLLPDPRIEHPNKETKGAHLRDKYVMARTFRKVDSSGGIVGRTFRRTRLVKLVAERYVVPPPRLVETTHVNLRREICCGLFVGPPLCLQGINIVKSEARYRGRLVCALCPGAPVRNVLEWSNRQAITRLHNDGDFLGPKSSLESDSVSNENPSSRSLKIP